MTQAFIERKLTEISATEEDQGYNRIFILAQALVDLGFYIGDSSDPEDYSKRKFEFGLLYQGEEREGEQRPGIVSLILWPYKKRVRRYSEIHADGDLWAVFPGPEVAPTQRAPTDDEKMDMRHGGDESAAQYTTGELMANIMKQYGRASNTKKP